MPQGHPDQLALLYRKGRLVSSVALSTRILLLCLVLCKKIFGVKLPLESLLSSHHLLVGCAPLGSGLLDRAHMFGLVWFGLVSFSLIVLPIFIPQYYYNKTIAGYS